MNIKVVNVFALDNQGGNPCAIVDNADKLSSEEMQTIATRLNLSETIYIIPNKDRYLLRFFATKGELPLCCHGVLGAAFYLLKLNQKKPLPIKTYNTHKIDVGYDSNLVYMSLINSGKILDTTVDIPTISDMLQISKSAISQNLPCVVASVGSPKLFIPIINRKLLFNIESNLDFIAKWSKANTVNGIYVYSNDTKDPNASYVARSFNPLFSHQEDIATGVAAAGLGHMLCVSSGKSEASYSIEQGDNLGKPSKIFIAITKKKITIKGEAYFLKDLHWVSSHRKLDYRC